VAVDILAILSVLDVFYIRSFSTVMCLNVLCCSPLDWLNTILAAVGDFEVFSIWREYLNFVPFSTLSTSC